MNIILIILITVPLLILMIRGLIEFCYDITSYNLFRIYNPTIPISLVRIVGFYAQDLERFNREKNNNKWEITYDKDLLRWKIKDKNNEIAYLKQYYNEEEFKEIFLRYFKNVYLGFDQGENKDGLRNQDLPK